MKFKLACGIDIPKKGSGSCDIDIETTPEELTELLKFHADPFAALTTLITLMKEMNNGNAQAHQ